MYWEALLLIPEAHPCIKYIGERKYFGGTLWMEFVVATEANVPQWDYTALITTIALATWQGPSPLHIHQIKSETKVLCKSPGQWEWSP
jgi:hypothetical protein